MVCAHPIFHHKLVENKLQLFSLDFVCLRKSDFSKYQQQHKVLPPSSVLRQVLNGSCKAEVTGEELSSPGQHQLVALPDGDVGDADHVGDLSLRPLVVAGLACHVDGGRSH